VASAVDLRDCRVVEVGSGRGSGSSFVKRYLLPAHMIGVDLSSHAVEFCRAVHHVDGLEFRVGDAEHLPVDTGSVDAVINVESSHCYPDFEKFLSEVKRVLKPGGHFLYAYFRQHSSLGQWRSSLSKSGMDLIRESNITRNVFAALEHDNAYKKAFIDRVVPRFLHPAFSDFAGMRGTVVYEGFKDGSLVYASFVLKNPY